MKRARHFIAGLMATALLFASLPVLAAEGGGGGRRININTADATQLTLLPRVGPSTAQRILEFRKKNGPFKTVEDLMLVSGIGEKTFQLMKPYVATAGETTLKEKIRTSRKKEDSR
ncbi:MAG: ComEA family DNA-binding protein [Thermoanaerobaculia bacterium]